jgi:hypothetical protein
VGTDKRVVVVTTAGEIQRLKEPVALTTPVLSDNGTKPVWIEAPTRRRRRQRRDGHDLGREG